MSSIPVVHFLAPHRHPRLRYVLKEVQGNLGIKFKLYTDGGQWKKAGQQFRMAYGVETGSSDLPHVAAHPFLSGYPPNEDDLLVTWRETIPYFFRVNTPRLTDKDYDPFACIFFALSRYEEYGEVSYDEHGRFSAEASHAYRAGYLHIPVVRIWTTRIGQLLTGYYPNLVLPPPRPFYFQPTYDIDLLWAYQYRGIRGIASGLRDVVSGKINRAFARFSAKAASDSYFTLNHLIELHEQEQAAHSGHREHLHKIYAKPQVFWLLANNDDRHDPNPFPIPPAQIAYIKSLNGKVDHGIHPSYRSSEIKTLIPLELSRLKDITGEPIDRGRQHFLRFQLPDTYRSLLAAGIRNEHSMGYADAVGWRAGTNLPFYWYDVEREEATYLTVHPFAAMDVTLKNYLGLKAQTAKEKVLELAGGARLYGGPFTLLWHNSSFAPEYGWGGWGEMYEDLVVELYRM